MFSTVLFIYTLFFMLIVAFINVFDNMTSAARQDFFYSIGALLNFSVQVKKISAAPGWIGLN